MRVWVGFGVSRQRSERKRPTTGEPSANTVPRTRAALAHFWVSPRPTRAPPLHRDRSSVLLRRASAGLTQISQEPTTTTASCTRGNNRTNTASVWVDSPAPGGRRSCPRTVAPSPYRRPCRPHRYHHHHHLLLLLTPSLWTQSVGRTRRSLEAIPLWARVREAKNRCRRTQENRRRRMCVREVEAAKKKQSKREGGVSSWG